MSEREAPTPQPRRWFHFSLRTLLLLALLIALPLGWVAKERRQSTFEAELAVRLERAGWQFTRGSILDSTRDFHTHPRQISWQHALAIRLFGERIIFAINSSAGQQELEQLAGLSNLQHLAVGTDDIVNLNFVNQHKVLKVLRIYCNREVQKVDAKQEDLDLAPLRALPKLKILVIQNRQVNDLAPLQHLFSLEGIMLTGTRSTHEQVGRLRDALPNCTLTITSNR